MSPGAVRRIAGWPVAWVTERLGQEAISLYVVADVERQIDRDRLLNDETYTPPYFALLWSGSRELARILAERGSELRGRSFLEVGCGLGLPSFVAAAAGAKVTALDREVDAIEFVKASAEKGRWAVEALVGDLEVLGGRRFDHVVAAELLYEPACFSGIVEALLHLVAPGGALWIADAERVDTSRFFDLIAAAGALPFLDQSREVREEQSLVRVRVRAYRPGIIR